MATRTHDSQHGRMTTPLLKATALLTGGLLLVAGSAYAGTTLAKNSVGSREVKNNSLTGQDLKDGTVGMADLVRGAAAKTYTFIDTVPEGNTQILDIPDFSRFEVDCSPSATQLVVRFGDADPSAEDPRQYHGIALADLSDNTPWGGVSVTGYSGGVGFSSPSGAQPNGGILVRGDYWGRATNRLAHGTISLGYPGTSCQVRVQVVVERLARPAPLARLATAGRTECEATGAAFCLPENG